MGAKASAEGVSLIPPERAPRYLPKSVRNWHPRLTIAASGSRSRPTSPSLGVKSGDTSSLSIGREFAAKCSHRANFPFAVDMSFPRHSLLFNRPSEKSPNQSSWDECGEVCGETLAIGGRAPRGYDAPVGCGDARAGAGLPRRPGVDARPTRLHHE